MNGPSRELLSAKSVRSPDRIRHGYLRIRPSGPGGRREQLDPLSHAGGSYPAMYAHILTEQTTYAVKGLTVDYQTATLNTLEGSTMCNGVSTPCEGLSEAMNWACSGTDTYQTTASGQTASSVELPFGYTDAVYSPYDDFMTPASYSAYVTCVDKDPHG